MIKLAQFKNSKKLLPILIMGLTLAIPINVHASEINLNSKKITNINEINKIIKENDLDRNNIKSVEEILVNDINREKVYKELNMEKEINNSDLEDQGAKKTDEKIYIIERKTNPSKFNSFSNLEAYNPWANLKNREIIHNENITYPQKDLTNGKTGMRTLLDRSLTIVIGSTTKYIGNVATILGVNPLDFLPKFTRGDILTTRQQNVNSYKYIQVSGDNGKSWFNCAKGTYIKAKTYIDLYTIDKNNRPIRKSDYSLDHFYSKYYTYESVLREKALQEYKIAAGMSMYIDPME